MHFSANVEVEEMETKPPVPNGAQHLAMVRYERDAGCERDRRNVADFKLNNEIIGTCMSALYQAGTCHRGHILESLCGRAYNLSCAAYDLTGHTILQMSDSMTKH